MDSDERFHGRELSFEQQDPSFENLERAGSREEPVEGFSMEQRNGTNFGSMRLTLSWISCDICILNACCTLDSTTSNPWLEHFNATRI